MVGNKLMRLKKLKRAILRSRTYYSLGSSIIGLPLTFLGFSRNIYGLIDNLPFMDILFPDFGSFLVRGGISLIPACALMGYLWMNSPFWREEKRVPAERNPFAYQTAPGRDTILFSGGLIGQNNMLRLFDKFGTITEEERTEFQRYLARMEIMSKGGSLRDSK